MATRYYSSDTPFLKAYFVVEEDGENEFQVSKYFSHVDMAAAFIEEVEEEWGEMELFISCILDDEMLQCALDSLKEGEDNV